MTRSTTMLFKTLSLHGYEQNTSTGRFLSYFIEGLISASLPWTPIPINAVECTCCYRMTWIMKVLLQCTGAAAAYQRSKATLMPKDGKTS